MNKKEILKSVKFALIIIIFMSVGGAILAACVSQGPSGSTICAPINDSTSSDVKAGGLSVGAFSANGASHITGNTSIGDSLTVTGVDSTLGRVRVESLLGIGVRNICTCGNGKLYVCGVTTACSNVSYDTGTSIN